MALTKCPECGRDNVSDKAEICPKCGYGIRSYFDKIKKEEAEKEQALKAAEEKRLREIEEKKQLEERIKNIQPLEKPQLTAPIVLFVFAAILLLGGIINLYQGEYLVGWLYILCGLIGFVFPGLLFFRQRIEEYNLSRTNFREYQKLVIKKQDDVAQEAELRARQASYSPECPYCHSIFTTKISTTTKVVNTAVFGVFGQKRKYQWHCNVCKSDF